MATFVNDTFTRADTVALSAHVGETGATWTLHPDGYFDLLNVSSSTGTVFCGNISGNTGYYASGIPAGSEYIVQADFPTFNTSQSNNAGIVGRMSTTANTFYMIRYNQSSLAWQLYEAIGGTFTLLDSYSQTLGSSNTYTVRLEITDAAKKVYIDDVLRINHTATNDITAAGRAGIRWFISGTGQTGLRIDNFSATDIGGGPAPIDINTNTGSLALVGNAATVEVGAGAPIDIAASTGTIALTGHQASVEIGAGAAISINASTGAMVLTGHQAAIELPVPIDINANNGALALTGHQASLSLAIDINANPGAINLVGNPATVELGAGAAIAINAATAALNLVGHSATVEIGAGTPIDIAANVAALALTGHTAEIQLPINLQANAGQIVLQGNRASVTLNVTTTPDFVGDWYLVSATPRSSLVTSSPKASLVTSTPRAFIH